MTYTSKFFNKETKSFIRIQRLSRFESDAIPNFCNQIKIILLIFNLPERRRLEKKMLYKYY